MILGHGSEQAHEPAVMVAQRLLPGWPRAAVPTRSQRTAFSVGVGLFDSRTVIAMAKGGASTPLVPGTTVWMSGCVQVIGCQKPLLLVIAAPGAGRAQPLGQPREQLCVCAALEQWDVQQWLRCSVGCATVSDVQQ